MLVDRPLQVRQFVLPAAYRRRTRMNSAPTARETGSPAWTQIAKSVQARAANTVMRISAIVAGHFSLIVAGVSA
jgi:hypothetical protein